MKAYTVQEARHYLERHVLLEIAETCLPFDGYFGEAETRRVLKQFDAFEQVGRYGANANFDPLAIRTPQMQTAGVSVWHQSHLNDLDGFVFKVRGLLRFHDGGRMDMLKAVLLGDAKNYFVASWKGPPLLKILTTGNRYFLPPSHATTAA
jgi:hypothetical protein